MHSTTPPTLFSVAIGHGVCEIVNEDCRWQVLRCVFMLCCDFEILTLNCTLPPSQPCINLLRTGPLCPNRPLHVASSSLPRHLPPCPRPRPHLQLNKSAHMSPILPHHTPNNNSKPHHRCYFVHTTASPLALALVHSFMFNPSLVCQKLKSDASCPLFGFFYIYHRT